MSRFRFSDKLKNRDWWGVAIDLLILIAGVFLGIQAANFNQDLQDRADGRAYVARIRDDLATDARNLHEHEGYWRDTAEAGARALRHAEEGSDRAPWLLINDLYGAGQNWNHSTIDATYDELRSAGQLDLIRDQRLRSLLADYYIARADEMRYLAESTSKYRLDIRAAVPFSLQVLLIDRCQRGFVRLFTGDCPTPSQSKAELAALVKKLTGDAGLMGELRSWMTNLRYVRSIARERRARAERIIAEIDLRTS